MNDLVAADAAGRYDELVRVSTQDSIPPEFVPLYQRILSSRSEREAMARAVEALMRLLHPTTLTVTKRNERGRFILVDNYLDGERWDYRIGEEPPEFSLTYAIEATGKVTYRDAALAERKETDEWFLGRSLVGIPIKALDIDEVIGTFVIGFEDASRLNETTAAIGSIVSAGYSAVVGNSAWLDEGVVIGRAIEQERMVQRLHDTAVQEIFACECAVKAIAAKHEGDQQLEEDLAGLLGLLHDANRDLRQVLADAAKRRTTASVIPIAPLVQEAIALHESMGGCPVTLMEDRTLEASDTIGDVLQSVLLEALANIRKHSRANDAVVSYGELSDGVVFLNVEDDGIGFVPRGQEGEKDGPLHFGIPNMNSIVRRTGGTFTVASEPGGGTAVRIRIPVKLEGMSRE